MSVPTCIYCGADNREPSAEHVIAAALGGVLELPPEMVCKGCNNQFERDIDRPVRKDLELLVVDLGALNREGEIASRVAEHVIDGEPRKFRVTHDQVYAADRRKLLRREVGRYEFRAASAEELEKARREIQAKHPDKTVVLSDVETRVPTLPDADRVEIDFQQAHWARWASKTASNVVAYVLGREVITDAAFQDLRRHAIGGGDAPEGLAWGGLNDASESTDELRPQQQISVQVDAGVLTVCVTLFGYCGFQLRREFSREDGSRIIVVDASAGRVDSDSGWNPAFRTAPTR